jgi:hypothetical protein
LLVAADETPNIPSLQSVADNLLQLPADGVEDELDRRSVCDLPSPRFKVPGPVVDQVIDAGGPAFEIQICRMPETSSEG